jgi:hypothetical protein
MKYRLRGVIQRSELGLVSMAAGSLWETFEAAHNWTYICDLARSAGILSAAAEPAHGSPLAMMVLGLVWAIGAHVVRHRTGTSRESVLAVGTRDANKLVRQVLECPSSVTLEVHNADGSSFIVVKGDQKAQMAN